PELKTLVKRLDVAFNWKRRAKDERATTLLVDDDPARAKQDLRRGRVREIPALARLGVTSGVDPLSIAGRLLCYRSRCLPFDHVSVRPTTCRSSAGPEDELSRRPYLPRHRRTSRQLTAIFARWPAWRSPLARPAFSALP